MERFDKYKLDDLKTWKKLSWLTTICYGFYCLSLIFNTLLEDVSENVDAMNESNLPLYILFFVKPCTNYIVLLLSLSTVSHTVL